MSPLKVINDRLAALTLRERGLVLVGGVAALAIVLYSLAWRPWQDDLNRLRTRVPEKEQTLAWMRAQSAQISSLTGSAKPASGTSGLPLLTMIERSANEVAVRKAITRMSPGNRNSRVRIWMHDADFDRWLRWLKVLKAHGIEVAEVTVDRSSGNKVNIRATLQR